MLAGGPLAGGAYLRFAPTARITGVGGSELVGPPHNRLLVSIAQHMGETSDEFGEAAYTADDGSLIDATGALDGVGP